MVCTVTVNALPGRECGAWPLLTLLAPPKAQILIPKPYTTNKPTAGAAQPAAAAPPGAHEADVANAARNSPAAGPQRTAAVVR